MGKLKHINLYLAGLVIISIAVFLPSISGGFLNWDDTTYITENPLIYNDISFSSFMELYAFDRYISLVLFSFLIQIKLFGNQPEWFHLINILIHTINILLVFKLSSSLLRSEKTSLFIALLFAIFPTKPESVCWIAQRKDLLFTMFFLISALSYLRFIKEKDILWFFITILSSYLSVMCKLQALAIVPGLLLIEYYQNGKIQYKSWFLITGIFLIMLMKISHLTETVIFILLPMLIGFYHEKLNKFFHFINIKIRIRKRIHNIRITDLIFYYYFCSVGGTLIYSFITGTIFQDFSEISFYMLLQLNAVFILYILYYKPRFYISRNKIKFFIVLFIIAVFTTGTILFFSDKMLQDGWALLKSNNVFYPFYSLNYYLYRFIFPFNLNAMIPYPESAQSLPLIYKLSPVITILIASGIIIAVKQIKDKTLQKNMVFGLLFFLVNIAFVLHIIPIKGKVIVADRYTYLAYFGLSFSLICLLEFIYCKLKHRPKKHVFQLVSIAVILVLTMQTVGRSKVYVNDKMFWGDVILKNKDNDYAWYSRGLYFFEKGDYEKAIEHYDTAIKLNNNNYEYFANRGGAYYKAKDYEKALADFNKAISFNPVNHTAYNNRGALYLKTGQPKQAHNDFLKATSLHPDYPEASKNLKKTTQILYPDGKQNSGKKDNKALADYYNSIGIEHAMQGKMRTALTFFDKAISCDKTNTKALKNRGNTLAGMERFDEAKASYLRILEINPGNAGALMNLGNILHQTGQVNKACQYWRKALKNGHDDAEIMINKYCQK